MLLKFRSEDKETKSCTNPPSQKVTCPDLAHVESYEERSQHQDGG